MKKIFFTLALSFCAALGISQDFINFYNFVEEGDTLLPCEVIIAANEEVVYLQPLAPGEAPTHYVVLQGVHDGEEHFVRAKDGKFLYSIMANKNNAVFRSEYGDAHFYYIEPERESSFKGDTLQVDTCYDDPTPLPVIESSCDSTLIEWGYTEDSHYIIRLFEVGEQLQAEFSRPGRDPFKVIPVDDFERSTTGGVPVIFCYYMGHLQAAIFPKKHYWEDE